MDLIAILVKRLSTKWIPEFKNTIFVVLCYKLIPNCGVQLLKNKRFGKSPSWQCRRLVRFVNYILTHSLFVWFPPRLIETQYQQFSVINVESDTDSNGLLFGKIFMRINSFQFLAEETNIEFASCGSISRTTMQLPSCSVLSTKPHMVKSIIRKTTDCWEASSFRHFGSTLATGTLYEHLCFNYNLYSQTWQESVRNQ